MTSLKSKGNQHVLNVYSALIKFLNHESIDEYLDGIKQNVDYLIKKYPNIADVKVKFDFSNPDDHPDLTITLENDETIKVNLFSIEGKGKIQPKNIGVKSFLKKYFQLEDVQRRFNELVEQDYDQFLKSVIATYGKVSVYAKTSDLKKRVHVLYPKFTDEINPIRRSFLFNLREQLFELLQHIQETKIEGFFNGFKELMLLDSIIIITRYRKKNKRSVLEELKFDIQLNESVQLYKKGNDTIGIRIGETALTLRLKFESSPTSSLKLATSYDTFPTENDLHQINEQSLKRFGQITKNHTSSVKKDDSNAVGKCNEALIYSSFIETYPTIYQIDNQEFCDLITKYSSKVLETTMHYLQKAAQTAVTEMQSYLEQKYDNYEVESIQLVPQNYIKDRLDTADLQLMVIHEKKMHKEDFSLKAARKSGTYITMKNPGAGTILGENFFDIGSLTVDIDRVKERFLDNKLTHKESIEEISKVLGARLEQAAQLNLKKGLEALLGKAVTVVTFYVQNSSVYFEHNEIDSEINVQPRKPTKLNTLLTWNEGKEYMKLRVKFSGGQKRGWTSIKLACEYKVE